MAKVNKNMLRQWQDGDTIHGPEYNRERDLLVESYNDSQAQIDALKSTTVPAVSTAMIQNGAVTEPKLADGNVTTVKLAPAAVTTDKIADQAVLEQKIMDRAITAVKIALEGVNTEHIKPGAITSLQLATAAILAQHIAAGAVDSTRLADSAVTPTKITKGAVTQFTYDSQTIDQKLADALAGGMPQEVIDRITAQVSADLSLVKADVATMKTVDAEINQKLNGHLGNADIHVTAAQKTAWDAKETPAGAQQKANTAETNAKNASFPRNGGNMNGTIVNTNELPLYALLHNKKSWGHHASSTTGHYYISPSATPGSTDWDWSRGITITEGDLLWPGGSLNGLKTSVVDGKNQIASAINGKGVAASGSDPFLTLAHKIGQISTGGRYVYGFDTPAVNMYGNPEQSNHWQDILTIPSSNNYVDIFGTWPGIVNNTRSSFMYAQIEPRYGTNGSRQALIVLRDQNDVWIDIASNSASNNTNSARANIVNLSIDRNAGKYYIRMSDTDTLSERTFPAGFAAKGPIRMQARYWRNNGGEEQGVTYVRNMYMLVT